MKFSILLCLLPFALSVAELLFEIPKEPSLNVWTIAQDESIERIPFEKVQTMKFRSTCTYIIIEVQEPNNKRWTCRAFYWVGIKTLLSQRKMTASLIPRMGYELREQLNNNLDLINLSREEQYKEGYELQLLFKMKSNVPKRLYKVTGNMGQYIIEVPWKYFELNDNDSFLFERSSHVYIWNADPIHNEHKQLKAAALGVRISNVEKCDNYMTLNIRDESSSSFKVFRKRFFESTEDGTFNFPKHLGKISDNDILNKRNKELELFEYSLLDNVVICKDILKRPLELDDFKTDKTYVMIDHYIGHLFIYIGNIANIKIIETAMSDAEYTFLNMELIKQDGLWRNITVVREGYPLPTHFIVNFPKAVENLGYYQMNEKTISFNKEKFVKKVKGCIWY